MFHFARNYILVDVRKPGRVIAQGNFSGPAIALETLSGFALDLPCHPRHLEVRVSPWVAGGVPTYGEACYVVYPMTTCASRPF